MTADTVVRDPSGSSTTWRAAGVLLLSAGALAVVGAVLSFAFGGLRTEWAGVTISIRSANRAAWVAILLSTAGLVIHPTLSRRLAGRLARLPSATAPGSALLLAAAILTVGVVCRPAAAGTADVYGYISQANLWLRGDLTSGVPIAATVPWPNADWTFAPLGYRPGRAHTIVPSYPPGLPLLLAAAAWLFGPGAMFVVVPMSAAATVWLTYLVGARLFDRTTGAMAAAAVATSPVVLMMTCWLLGDLPTVPFWLASLLLALNGTRRSSVLSGLVAGAALLIRPNLLPLLAIPVLASLSVRAASDGSGRARRVISVVAGCAPLLVWLGWHFDRLYGSPMTTGYGDPSHLFATGHFSINVRQLAVWWFESHGPFVALATAGFLFAPRTGGGHYARSLCTASIVLTLACYVFYRPFELWWYLRFLLPAVPAVALLMCDGLLTMVRRLAPPNRRLAAFAFVMLVAGYGLTEAFDRDVFSIGRREVRYADAGAFISSRTPANAVFLTMVHSGAARHHGGRLTLRYDYIEPDWLDRVIDWLVRAGYEPYLLIDREERVEVQPRFRGQAALSFMEPPPAPASCTHAIELYPLARPAAVGRPTNIPRSGPCRD